MTQTKYISGDMLGCLKRYWGFESFRPWQEDTILAILEDRETLTILPTGGGKSLCFQLPALLKDGMAVVISPLISLMKDQVDGLQDMGIAAEYLNSSLTPVQQRAVTERIAGGEIKLLYISPERLQTRETVDLLSAADVSFFVIDEAHCISHWGHDFREDYRHLGNIRRNFSGARIHAFTATATPEVQADILSLLRLDEPRINVASVDRPNLSYRVLPRAGLMMQINEVLAKHPGEAGIIYCLRRKDVDEVSADLNRRGVKNLPYHAGLTDQQRRSHQEQFIREEVNLVVATVAFGMGIDRPDIRFVIHAAMPKSIEHYHQETGRAGRDGLPAACYLFYGGGDFRVWSFFAEQSGNRDVMLTKLRHMYNFCAQPQCRHQVFVHYFGQTYPPRSCGACDFCLGEVDMVDDPQTLGRGIVDCVAGVQYRDGQGFGAGYVANVLKGQATDQVLRWGHEHHPRFGALSAETLNAIRYWIEQLIGQGFLVRQGEYDTLGVTERGRKLLAGDDAPLLARPLVAAKKKANAARQKVRRERDWEGVDQNLFELLRQKRAELAQRKGVPAYIIFGDRSLKDMASVQPTTLEAFAGIFGVGERKLKSYAQPFLDVIRKYQADAD